MRVAVTGGTGLVARFVVEAALAAGDAVTVLARTEPAPGYFSAPVGFHRWELGQPAPLEGADALVHAAFHHVPGRYRGGEGDDPMEFLALNLAGSVRLFEAAKAAGVARVVFLSSRAVYGGYPPGIELAETMEPRPDTLYGRVKREAEQALAALEGDGLSTAALRATGVYGPAGPGRAHKWADLFARFDAGEHPPPRVGTELHGHDLASAVRLLLESRETGTLNASGFVLDRRDLLAAYAGITGVTGRLPERADAAQVSAMRCDRLAALGWTASGAERLDPALREMLSPQSP